MKKYKVTLYYHTNCTVEVEAENEEDAIDKAREEACSKEAEQEILSGLNEDSDPDVEEIVPMRTTFIRI